MIQELHDIQTSADAIFTELTTGETVAVSFGNDPAAITATKQGVALCDRTHWGRIQISDSDRLRFLHNQTTNNINKLQPGQGCDTVFVTSTARTIDLATAYATEDAVLLLVSPNRRRQLLELLDRYIFPMDRVELTDLTDTTVSFSLLGPESSKLLAQIGVSELENQPYATHKLIKTPPLSPPYQGGERGGVRVAVGSG